MIRPAAVVTEIMIPRLDGLTLCRRLGEDKLTRHIPVVVFSILSAASRAEDAGAKAFLRKPIVGSVFVATLEQLIAAHPNGVKEKQWASQQ
jgi:CheY-like chemotaxis protein